MTRSPALGPVYAAPRLLTVGRTQAGRPVGVSTALRTRVALVGPPDSGKTTACRRLIRRWQHFELGGGGVLATRRAQYEDLPVDLISAAAGRVTGRYGLLVIDQVDRLPLRRVVAACRDAHRIVILAGWGGRLAALNSWPRAQLDHVLSVRHAATGCSDLARYCAEAVPVLLDPIASNDVEPLRRRTQLNGILIEDDEDATDVDSTCCADLGRQDRA